MKDKFFRLAFLVTILVMLIVFSSNLERAAIQPMVKEKIEKVIYKKIDIEKIKELIERGKLSDKEALFYKIIKEE